MQAMPSTKEKPKKEKPIPKRCVCGKQPAVVKIRRGVMLTCPDFTHCPANLRTRWVKGIDAATVEWNGIVDSYKHTQKCL